MTAKRSFLSIALLLTAPLVCAQQVYKWVDEDGNVHYSQTLPPERATAAHETLNSEGLVVERTGTVEEQREKQAREAAAQAAEAASEKQAREDRLFLASFPTEADVRRMIESRRETVLAEQRSVEGLIDQNRERFASLIERAAEAERQGKPVPESLVRQIDDARAAIERLGQRMTEIDQRLSALDAELEAGLARHRRLTDSG